MNKQILKTLIPLLAILLLAACSSAPTAPAETATKAAPKEPAKPPEAVAAQSAFFEMYKPARTWATDLLPLTLASGEIPGIKNEGGKAARWTVVFVSPSKHEARTFFYAVADSGTEIHKGVDMGGSQPWSGPTPKARPFTVAEFATNSDAAYKVAMEKAAPWVQKNPTKKLSMYLANASSYQAPLWYLVWGDNKDGYIAHISATTGTAVTIK